MSDFTAQTIRNIAFIAHADSGKTMLAEAMLFNAKAINRMGTVEEGTTVSDYNRDEIERRSSINSSFLHCIWKKVKLNILDTPGFPDFTGEVKASLSVADCAVVPVNAVSGIEVGTELVWGYAEESQLPRMIVINKLDRENADFDQAVSYLRQRFGDKIIETQFPIGPGPQFSQIVDVVNMKLLEYPRDGSGKVTIGEIPADAQERAEELREKLIEVVAEADDALLEKYLDAGELTDEEFETGLKNAIASAGVFPVFCTAAAANIGVDRLMDFIVSHGVSPLDRPTPAGTDPDGKEQSRPIDPAQPLTVFVFKTVSEMHVGELSLFKVISGKLKAGLDVRNQTRGVSERIGQMYLINGKERREAGELTAGDMGAVVKLKSTQTGDTLCDPKALILMPEIQFPSPVIRTAVVPRSRGDEEKISNGLHTLHAEDPSFLFQYDPELRQTIISGQGELHLNIVIQRLKEKFGVEVDTVEPRIPYRETIKGKSEVQGKYKKQTGGRGQYGDVWLRLEPRTRGEGTEFIDAIVGGAIPGKFIPSVEKGVVETLQEGVLAGYPVVDVQTTLYDGSFHTVDSSDMAFKIAGSMAFKKAFMEAKPYLLEPIYQVEVTVPEEYMGDVMGDLSSRRGKIQGMDSSGPFQIIRAQVPLAELYKYSTALRSLTNGRGIHRRQFSHYEEVPHDLTAKILEKAKAEKEAGESKD